MKIRQKNSSKYADSLKIAAILICIGCISVIPYQPMYAFAIPVEWNIVLEQNGRTLKEVFSSIEKSTGYKFIYPSSDIDLERKVNAEIDVRQQPIHDILHSILTGTNLSYTIEGSQIVLRREHPQRVVPVTQQDRKITVTGIVTDEEEEPVIGANIMVKGTAVGTVTDVDGKFHLPDVDPDAVLVVSFIGYESEEIKAGSSLAVRLRQDHTLLNEIVVVGYGSMTRKDVTSSITTIRSDQLNQGVYSSPAQLLQGKVPGLTITQNSNPNATPSVTLRGASTLRTGAAMEPYYVIDGVPGGSLALIAPDDIESIDVLRDASATAIYGSKAANGVIIVTTKRGQAGQTNVSYSGYLAVDRVAKNWDLMTGDQYKAYVLDNGFSLDPYDDRGADTDWQKEVQRTGISQNHNVSINGGYEKTIYNASLNYMKNQGVIKGTEMERYIGRAFVETKTINDRLTLAFNLNASVTKQNDVLAEGQGISVYDAMCYYLPISPVKNEDGSWFEYGERSQYANPVSLIEENTIFSKTKFIQANARSSFVILPGLVYNLDLSLQNEQYNHNRYYSSQSMAATGMNGKATRAAVENEKTVMEMHLNYDKTFDEVHKLGAMAGYSWEESNNNDGFQASTYNFFNDALKYYNLGMANNVDLNGFGGYALSTLRMISFFGRLNYSYDSRYLFQATVRRDGSSAFGINNRWATFPSTSLAWRVSEESFIKNLNLFDDLKLRAGYGVSGNSLGFDVFTATQVYGATGWFTNSSGEEVRTLGATRNSNPDLKWERTGMLNIGMDFAFFNNRLSGTIEYYNKNTKDLIYDYPVSTTRYLYNYLTTNVGEINNKGIEFTVNAMPVKTADFMWNTSANLSHNKNKVVKISNDEFSVDYIDLADLDAAGQSSNRQQRIMEGYPIGQFYTWEWAGYNEEGVSIFYVRDAETGERTGETTTTPVDKDRAATGSAQPKLTFGWNNSFTYKNVTLTAFFQGVFGNKIMNATRARYSNVRGNAGNKNLLVSVMETENVSDYNSHYLSDRYLEKGDYVRLSALSLAYDIPKVSDWVKNIRLYVTLNNVFVLTDYKGIDPEVNLGGLTPGIDNRQTYPRTRTFMFGANINF